MFLCDDIDIGVFDNPTVCVSVDIAVRPDQLFEILEDPDAWPVWLKSITHVAWTSPDPKGIGTTRTVTIAGDFVADEEFIAWEPGARMAFRFTQSSRRVFRAFAEDYRVTKHGGGSRLTWSVVARPRGVPAAVLRPLRPILAAALRPNLDRLRGYATERYGDS
jgi:uncharacterized protein YndB with AHSA1/START domain